MSNTLRSCFKSTCFVLPLILQEKEVGDNRVRGRDRHTYEDSFKYKEVKYKAEKMGQSIFKIMWCKIQTCVQVWVWVCVSVTHKHLNQSGFYRSYKNVFCYSVRISRYK